MNSNKSASDLTIVDPFAIQAGWFHLDLASLFVDPNPELANLLRARIQTTIDVLKLNDDTLVESRFDVYTSYLDGQITLAHLSRWYPFIAAEVVRQAAP